jgi:hypothetical protein
MLYGPMGYANAQRSLDYIRILAEFISQPQYRDVVVMFGITNEPQGSGVSPIGRENIQRFYLEAYNVVRAASGSGQGPWISYHEAFLGLNQWVGFLPGADRISLDQHPYVSAPCFFRGLVCNADVLPVCVWQSALRDSGRCDDQLREKALRREPMGPVYQCVDRCVRLDRRRRILTGSHRLREVAARREEWLPLRWDIPGFRKGGKLRPLDGLAELGRYVQAEHDAVRALQYGCTPGESRNDVLGSPCAHSLTGLVLLDVEDWQLLCD